MANAACRFNFLAGFIKDYDDAAGDTSQRKEATKKMHTSMCSHTNIFISIKI